MNKNLIFRLLSYLVLLLAPLFWLLSIVAPNAFGWFNFSNACGFVFAGLGLIIITKNAIISRLVAYKKLALILAGIFEIIALICFVSGFAIPKNVIAPIICIIIAIMLIIGLFIAGTGTKWDEGDNHKEGYKNYYERKAEEEQKEQQLKEKDEVKEEKTENNTAEEA